MNWELERRGGLDPAPDLWLVINRKTGETHKFATHASAMFIRNLFNEQEHWYNWERHGYSSYTATSDPRLMVSNDTYSFIRNTPSANWRMDFGDESNTYFTMYLKNGPGWFRRKMFRLILGITWSKI